jgi:amino acid permease
MSKVAEAQYLKKSIKLFRVYSIAFLVSMFTVSFLRSISKDYSILYEMLITLPFLIILILAPIGLYYNWKSYKTKEEPRKKRTMFFMGHLFFCMMIILMFVSVIKELIDHNW